MTEASGFRVLAIVSTYNEADIVEPVIRHLVENGADVYLIDNGSTDETVERARPWLGRGLLKIENLPPTALENGLELVSWAEILRRKAAVAREVPADWYIHHDADEVRESPWPGLSLREAIHWVDGLGFNAIDFRVLNFPPVDNAFEPGLDPRDHFRRFEDAPEYDRIQIKAWRARGDVTLHDGGHEVVFPERSVFPIQFILRHYPIRSQEHGVRKVFGERKHRFVESEREVGWHIQYDAVEGEDHVFLRNPASLRTFDLERIRLEVQLDARPETAPPDGRSESYDIDSLDGFLDRVSPERIVGWARDSESPRPVEVDLFDGPRFLGSVRADQRRPDLVAAGFGEGRHGFSFPTPDDVLDGRAHVIWANFAGTARTLRNSPLAFGPASNPATGRGTDTHLNPREPALQSEVEPVDVAGHLESG